MGVKFCMVREGASWTGKQNEIVGPNFGKMGWKQHSKTSGFPQGHRVFGEPFNFKGFGWSRYIYIYSAIGEQNDSGNFPLFLPQKNVRAALPGLVSCGWWTWVGPRVHHHLQLNLHRPAIALRFPSWRFPHIPIESHWAIAGWFFWKRAFRWFTAPWQWLKETWYIYMVQCLPAPPMGMGVQSCSLWFPPRGLWWWGVWDVGDGWPSLLLMVPPLPRCGLVVGCLGCWWWYVCMCVCVYVCMYVCMHVCMYVCNVCMHACMYVCMYVCVYVCMCVYVMYVLYVLFCMYVCMYVCMYDYVCNLMSRNVMQCNAMQCNAMQCNACM